MIGEIMHIASKGKIVEGLLKRDSVLLKSVTKFQPEVESIKRVVNFYNFFALTNLLSFLSHTLFLIKLL